MSRVLETSSDSLNDARLDLGRRVVEVEVLSSSLTNDSWVTLVLVNVVTDSLPEISEDVGGSSEVETGKVLVVDTLTDNLGRVAWNELDDGWGNTSF